MLLRRWFMLPTAAQLVLAVVLCFVPLFHLLGYDFAFATGLLTAITAPIIGLNRAGSGSHTRGAVAASVGLALLHLLPALMVMALNALRVPNCNFWHGLLLFLLLPGCSAAYGAALGAAVAQLASNLSRSTRLSLTVLVVSAPLLWTLGRLYWAPPMVAYDHLWGYFAGSLYDEAVQPDRTLLIFRLGTLLRIGAIVCLLRCWRTHHKRGGMKKLAQAVVVLGAALLLFEQLVGPYTGFRVSRRHIEQELSQVLRRPGIVVHLPPAVDAVIATAIADEHAFRLAQLHTRLGLAPQPLVHSYVYADTAQKQRLLGGATTMIAKPWLREMHLIEAVSPHPMLAHELAHVVAGSFGARPLAISANYGLWAHMGLVEGLAEALAPDDASLTLDHGARALRDLGLAPDVRTLMGPSGFWREPPRRAYTVAGSFVRYLLNTYGPEPLKLAYAHADFAGAYGKSLDALASEWEQYLGTLHMSNRELLAATQLYRTPSILARPCAREITALRHQAAQASEPEQAVALYRQICNHLGNDATAHFDLAMALKRANDATSFMMAAHGLAHDDRLTAAQRAQLAAARAEVFWEQGRLEEARSGFALAAQHGLSPEFERLQIVRLWALEQPAPLQLTMRDLLAGRLNPVAAVVQLRDFMPLPTPSERGDAASSMIAYLLARQLHRVQAYDLALTYLDRAQALPQLALELERLRLKAACAEQLGRFAEAEKTYRLLLDKAPTAGQRAQAADLLARLKWRMQAR